MTPEEKKIEEAAKTYLVNKYSANFTDDSGIIKSASFFASIAACMISFATASQQVKEYWQKGMYTEEEVETLFKNWLNTKINEELMRISGELGYFEGVTFGDWFEQNKKKE